MKTTMKSSMKELLTTDEPAPTYTKGYWIGLAFGLPLIAYGIRGVLAEIPGVQLTSFIQFFVGGAIIHDVIVAPLVCVIGWSFVRRLPTVAMGPVQAALLVSAVVSLVSWPFVRGYGITPTEPSFLSRNYTASLLLVLAVTWFATAATIGYRVVSARRR